MPGHETKKFWLIIDGKIVTDHKIEAYSFGKLLTNLQRVVDILHETKHGSHPKTDFRLYITHMTEGSVAVAFQPRDFTTELFKDSFVFDEMVFNLNDFVTQLIESSDMFREKIEREFSDPATRIRFLENFSGLLSRKNKFNVRIGYSLDKPEKPVMLPSHREGFIHDLIQEYYRKSMIEIKGVITRIHGDDPRSFTIKTLDNSTVKCSYPSEWEKDLMALFKSSVTVSGVMSQKAKMREMDVVKDIHSFNSTILENLGETTFRQPLSVRVSYDDKEEHWGLENSELSLSGYGKTYQEALTSLSESLDSLIIEYLAFKDDELSSKSLHIKKNLQNYLDLNEVCQRFDGLTVGS
jgi:hypothetical protein